MVGQEHNTENIPTDTKESMVYQEIFVDSFESAVDGVESDIRKDRVFLPSPEHVGSSNFCLLDIDGVLIEDDLVKLPLITHAVKPNISNTNVEAFKRLVNIFGNSIVISTNRSRNEKWIFNSKKLFSNVDALVSSTGKKIPIFSHLFKQFPKIAFDNIKETYPYHEEGEELREKRIINVRANNLVNHIANMVGDGKSITLFSIEDWSIASLNRKTFLKYITKKLHKEYGIKVEVKNYVVKRE